MSWGLNQHGQCGISHLTDELTTLGDSNFKVSSSGLVTNVYMPVRVKEVTAPVEMHCGWSHTLVIAGELQFDPFLVHTNLEVIVCLPLQMIKRGRFLGGGEQITAS